MKKEEFLKEYVNTPSPSGYEVLLGGQLVWLNYIKKYSKKVEVDDYGNAYAFFGNLDSDYTVLIDAHGDEIGFFVHDITEQGFIKVGRLGGSDVSITPSSRVDIWSEKGMVNGVFGHPAIHVQDKSFKVEIDRCFIDIGVSSKKEVLDKGIEVGTPITMSDGYMDLGEYHCGRSLDDKIGGYITSQVLRKMSEKKIELDYKLVIVNAVQEEVGLYGAKMASNKIEPNVTIAIDVTHDTSSPAYDKNKLGSITAGKGVVLANGPSIQKNVLKLLKKVCKKEKLQYQLTATGRGSGTNADSYAYPYGIPTALLKMGMRYMHTTVETVHKKDVKDAIKLLYKVLQSKGIKKSFNYIKDE